MRCDDVMTRVPVVLAGHEPLEVAARRMVELRLGFLPVCDEAGHVIGSLGERDLVRALAAGLAPGAARVDAFLDRDVQRCAPTDELERAHALMRRSRRTRLVVTDPTGLLLGVVSLSDLARHDPTTAGETLRAVTAGPTPAPARRRRKPRAPAHEPPPRQEEPAPPPEPSLEPWE